MHPLWYDTSRQLELDNLLLVVAQTGVFIYSAFCIIGSFFQLEEHLLAFLASLATLVQTTLQTAFILDASSRFACTNDQVIFFGIFLSFQSTFSQNMCFYFKGHSIKVFNNYVNKMRGSKNVCFCPRGGGGVKKWQSSVHVVVE